MTPEDRRRRGLTRVAIGVGLLLIVIVLTFMMLPRYAS
jgi:hypothetical protein